MAHCRFDNAASDPISKSVKLCTLTTYDYMQQHKAKDRQEDEVYVMLTF